MSENQFNVFSFTGSAVRAIVQDGKAWFAAKDVCDVLGIVNSNDAASKLPEKCKQRVGKAEALFDNKTGSDVIFINEAGVYRLVFKSKKPEAEAFTDWVTEEVLPQIREKGYYAKPEALAVLKQMAALPPEEFPALLKGVSRMSIPGVAVDFKYFNDVEKEYSKQWVQSQARFAKGLLKSDLEIALVRDKIAANRAKALSLEAARLAKEEARLARDTAKAQNIKAKAEAELAKKALEKAEKSGKDVDNCQEVL